MSFYKRIRRFLIAEFKYYFKIPQPVVNKDRAFLEGDVFGYLNTISQAGQSLLFIGVASYTKHYYNKLNYNVFTIDFSQKESRYGRKGQHVVGSALALSDYYAQEQFSVIVANGLIGYGLTGRQEFDTLLAMCAHCLAPGGVLVVGYNNNKNHLDFSLPEVENYALFKEFIPPISGLDSAARLANPDNDHTFVFLQKRPTSQP